ncbi:MAG TPA: DJ-1/PfpI family protein [Spirochaetales bacterium]|nr:DJ-1/PfpI family protein [Spirochaetia bacterium]HPE35995.1 DJ-1/PfpI family protein [Spirochaetales bacterium]
MKRACVLLANGCEEVEAVTPIDYLRRAGVEVVSAGTTGRDILGSRGIALGADAAFDDIDDETFDCVVVPGGSKGAEALAADADVVAFIQRHAAGGAVIGAICAAPAVVLGQACGLLGGRRFTCYPGLERLAPEGRFQPDRVIIDGRLVSARAAGCAGEFAEALAAVLMGDEAAARLRESVLL